MKPKSKDLIDDKLSSDIDSFLTEQEEEELAQAVGEEIAEEDVVGGSEFDPFIFKEEEEPWEYKLRRAMAKKIPALIMIGESGVGKTTMLNNMAKKYLVPIEGKNPVAYFNAPTMDPFIHLVGLPHVSENKRTEEFVLSFVRKSGVEFAQLLVLDEINRVTPDNQNALFELVATRQINGEKLGRVKMVWGAMNPPRKDLDQAARNVIQVDQAFAGRFHWVVEVRAAPKLRHYVERGAYIPGVSSKVTEKTALKCLRWWYRWIEKGENEDTHRFYKDIITPRVLEYIMQTVQDLRDEELGHREIDGGPLIDRLGEEMPEEWREEMTPEKWDMEFEAVAEHHKLHVGEEEAKLPFEELKRTFFGMELYELSSLLNNSKNVNQRIAEIQDVDKFPEAGSNAASVIADGMRSTRRHAKPLIPFYRVGEFSKVLCSMDPELAVPVLTDKPQIAGYLYAKVVGNEAIKKAYSRGNEKNPVWLPATQGDKDLFNHFKDWIMMAVKESEAMGPGQGPQPGGIAPKPGAPGGVKPAVPKKKP